MARFDYQAALQAGYSPEEINKFMEERNLTAVGYEEKMPKQKPLGVMLQEKLGQGRALPAGLDILGSIIGQSAGGTAGRRALGTTGAATGRQLQQMLARGMQPEYEGGPRSVKEALTPQPKELGLSALTGAGALGADIATSLAMKPISALFKKTGQGISSGAGKLKELFTGQEAGQQIENITKTSAKSYPVQKVLNDFTEEAGAKIRTTEGQKVLKEVGNVVADEKQAPTRLLQELKEIANSKSGWNKETTKLEQGLWKKLGNITKKVLTEELEPELVEPYARYGRAKSIQAFVPSKRNIANAVKWLTSLRFLRMLGL